MRSMPQLAARQPSEDERRRERPFRLECTYRSAASAKGGHSLRSSFSHGNFDATLYKKPDQTGLLYANLSALPPAYLEQFYKQSKATRRGGEETPAVNTSCYTQNTMWTTHKRGVKVGVSDASSSPRAPARKGGDEIAAHAPIIKRPVAVSFTFLLQLY